MIEGWENVRRKLLFAILLLMRREAAESPLIAIPNKYNTYMIKFKKMSKENTNNEYTY